MRTVSLALLSAFGCLIVIAGCGSDSDKTKQNDSGGSAGQLSRGGGAGTHGSVGGALAGTGATNAIGGAAGQVAAVGGSSGQTAEAGGAGVSAGQGGASGNAGQGVSGGSAGALSVADVECTTDDECTAVCKAHGWPDGHCNGVTTNYCYCTSNGSPSCTRGSTEGCPSETFCRSKTMCTPYGSGVDGDPCPNANECSINYICVGYGNPLPNGERTACRQMCDVSSPPPNCECQGGGYCKGGTAGAAGSSGASGSAGSSG